MHIYILINILCIVFIIIFANGDNNGRLLIVRIDNSQSNEGENECRDSTADDNNSSNKRGLFGEIFNGQSDDCDISHSID